MSEKSEILHLLSGDYETTFNKMHRNRKQWTPDDPKKILSFMPGAVVEYRVKAGDSVKAGDTLLLFKAMKMNNRMLAPMDGKVKNIGVGIGENVPKNTVLIELE